MEMTRLLFIVLRWSDVAAAKRREMRQSGTGTRPRIAAELKADNFKCLIAEAADSSRIGLGGATINTLEGVFGARKIIHIGVLFVSLSFRRKGVVSKLPNSRAAQTGPPAACGQVRNRTWLDMSHGSPSASSRP